MKEETQVTAMKALNLTLNKKWFDMIASGVKTEEYREIKPYWINRFVINEYKKYRTQVVEADIMATYRGEPLFYAISKDFDIVSANNGYSKDCPNVKWKHEGITIGEGKPEWGAIPGKKYFILKIGDLIK